MGIMADHLDVGMAFILLAAASLIGGFFCILAGRAASRTRKLEIES
jgi:hypothetical protein